MTDNILKEFFAYWRERIRRGETSRLSGVECITLEIFLDWLKVKYRLEPLET